MSVLISSTSPLSGLVAEVVCENGCSYLYLYRPEAVDGSATCGACWIKNHITVGEGYMAKDDMDNGLQPRMPTHCCTAPEDLSPLDKQELEIVWGQEGTMVSIFAADELICVIPYWANENFSGYSKYSNTAGTPLLPYPLGSAEDNALFARMLAAKQFWAQDFSEVWSGYQQKYLDELEEMFGKHVKYFAIDGGKFPPKALATFEKDDLLYALTIGVGMFPQPKVDMYCDEPHKLERFELGFCCAKNAACDVMKVYSQLSSLTGVPWVQGTFLAANHTVALGVNEQYTKAVLVHNDAVGTHRFNFLENGGVNLLWVVPIDDGVYAKLTAEEPDYSDVDSMVASKNIAFAPQLLPPRKPALGFMQRLLRRSPPRKD